MKIKCVANLYVCLHWYVNSTVQAKILHVKEPSNVKEGIHFVGELCVQMHVNGSTKVTFSYYYALLFSHKIFRSQRVENGCRLINIFQTVHMNLCADL